MQNSDIHVGLPMESIRELISNGFNDCFNEDTKDFNFPKLTSKDGNPLSRDVIRCEEKLVMAKNALVVAKKREALYIIMCDKGWEEFDVSDETRYTTRLAKNFIGTEIEYKELLERIEMEN